MSLIRSINHHDDVLNNSNVQEHHDDDDGHTTIVISSSAVTNNNNEFSLTYDLIKECILIFNKRQQRYQQRQPKMDTDHNDDFLSWWSALYYRCQQLDEQQYHRGGGGGGSGVNKSSLRNQLLLSCHDSDKYTPLHYAVYHGDIHHILFLLHQASLPSQQNTTSSSTSTGYKSEATASKRSIPIKLLIQFLLSERRNSSLPLSSSSTPTSSSSQQQSFSHLICQALDADGYTPGALLVKLQKHEIQQCREAIQQFLQPQVANPRNTRIVTTIHDDEVGVSNNRLNERQREIPRSIERQRQQQQQQQQSIRTNNGTNSTHVPTDFTDLEYQTQNEFELLTRVLQYDNDNHTNEAPDRDDEVNDDDSSDDGNEQQVDTHQTRQQPTNDDQTENQYGCEVLTFGSAHHCVRGVASTTITTTNTNSVMTSNKIESSNATTTASSYHYARPQRVTEFALEQCRSCKNGAVYVAASTYHTLVITEKGNLYSFGLGKSGRLGIGNESPCSIPVRVGKPLIFQQHIIIHVAAAENHSLAVTSNGLVYSWGSNRFGQLGITTTTNATSINADSSHTNVGGNCSYWPRRVDELKGIACIKVAAGLRHSVALTNDGAVYVWGDNSSGQLGILTTSSSTTSHKVHLVTSLWGSNSHRTIGNNKNNQSNKVRKQSNKGHESSSYGKRIFVTKISASDHATLVLGHPVNGPMTDFSNINSNVVYSWGHGNHVPYKVNFIDPIVKQQQQMNKTKKGGVAVLVVDDEKMNKYDVRYRQQNNINPIDIACARYHNVAITNDGRVYTWGLHANSLGTSTTSFPASSMATSPSKKSAEVSSTASSMKHSKNGYYMTEPQLVSGMLPEHNGGFVIGVSASENHTAVVTDTGDLFTWGESYHDNVLGHVGTRYQPSPKRVQSVHRVISVAVAKEHTVILMGTSFPMSSNDLTLPSDVIDHSSVPSLESIASAKVTEYIDMFNVLPIFLMAQRMQTSLLLQYCRKFIRLNLDGVLNVAQKSVLESYVKEQIVIGHDVNTFRYRINKYRDGETIHPILSDLLSAGNNGQDSSFNAVAQGSSTVALKQNSRQQRYKSFCFLDPLCSFDVWIKSCHRLSMEHKFHTSFLTLQAMTDNSEENNCYRHGRRRRFRSLSNASDTSDTENSGKMKNISKQRNLSSLGEIRGSNLTTPEQCQGRLSDINKEIRAIRKRLGQIARLENGIIDGHSNDNDVSDEIVGDYSSIICNLTSEQQQKIARRPQLQSDLASLEKGKIYVERRMQELRSLSLVASAKDIVRSIESENSGVHDGVHSLLNNESNNLVSPIRKISKQRKVSFAEDSNSNTESLVTEFVSGDCTNKPRDSAEVESNMNANNKVELKHANSSSDADNDIVLRRFACDCCNVTCPDQKSLELHMAGRKHRNKLTQIEENEKRVAADSVKAEQQKRQILSLSAQVSSCSVSSTKSPRSTCPWDVKTKSDQPRYKLPPPPHPVADSIVVNNNKVILDLGSCSKISTSITTSKVAVVVNPKKNLKDIMEEEARNAKTAAIKMPSSAARSSDAGSVTAKKADTGRLPTGSWLVPPPSASIPMKSVPWAKLPPVSETNIITSVSVKTADSSRSAAGSWLVPPPSASIPMKSVPWANSPPAGHHVSKIISPVLSGEGKMLKTNISTKSLASSPAPSLADFIPVLTSPAYKSKELKTKSSAPWKAQQSPENVAPNVTSPAMASRPEAHAKSFLEIQNEEQESKQKQVDHTTYVPDGGESKWFVERRERAGSFHEIQTETMRLEEERLLIEEQIEIEKQIYANIEAAKKATESSQDNKNEKKNKNKKYRNHHNKNKPKAAVAEPKKPI